MGSLFASSRFTQAIKNHLKNLIVTLGRNMTPQQQEAIDVTVAVIANDNVELACAFIQKKGIEKAIQETDKRLRSEFEARQVFFVPGAISIDPLSLFQPLAAVCHSISPDCWLYSSKAATKLDLLVIWCMVGRLSLDKSNTLGVGWGCKLPNTCHSWTSPLR